MDDAYPADRNHPGPPVRPGGAAPGGAPNPGSPRRLRAQHLTTITPQAWVGSVSFSPDGRCLAIARTNGPALVTDLTGQRLLSLGDATDKRARTMYDVAFSPDGARLATVASDKTVRLWDAATGREFQRFAHPGHPRSVLFSPDGSRLATRGAGTGPWVWDAGTGQLLWSHKHSAVAMAFSPDGTRLATSAPVQSIFSYDTFVAVLDAADGRELVRRKIFRNISCVAFGPDGDRFATAGDTKAHVYDAHTGADLLFVRASKRRVVALAFSPNGDWFASGGADNAARLWDSRTGAELLEIPHTSRLTDLAFSPDGTLLATVCFDKTVQLWSLAEG